MTPKQMEKAIDRIALTAEEALDNVLAEARAKYVVPFCDRHGCKFIAGMGSWSFHGGDMPEGYAGSTHEDIIGKRLYEVLTMEYPLNRMNDCGSLMQDYKPLNFKE